MIKKDIITLIEGTGLYEYDDFLTKNHSQNKKHIKYLIFATADNNTADLFIPIDIDVSKLSKILEKAYSKYYISIGKQELQTEFRKLLGL